MRRKPATLIVKDTNTDTWSAHILDWPIFVQGEPGKDWPEALELLQIMAMAYVDQCLEHKKEPFPIERPTGLQWMWPNHTFHDLYHNGEWLKWHTFHIPPYPGKPKGMYIDCALVMANQEEADAFIRRTA